MTTEDVINLDYTKEENQEKIQKVLRQIKPLSRYSDEERIPIEVLEKLIRVLYQKYEIQPQWMTISLQQPSSIYSIGVKTTNTHKWLGTVYGMCLYEVFSKLAIKMYSEVKNGTVKKRMMTKEEKQRERIIKKSKEE